MQGDGICLRALIQRRKLRVRPGQIEVVLRVPGSVAGRGHTLRLAVCQRLGIDAL